MYYTHYLLLIVLISLPKESLACDCYEISPLDKLRQISFNKSDMVFLGELIETNNVSNIYTFSISEIFKGKPQYSIIKGKYFSSCSSLLRDKGRWIVYADYKEPFIDISQCLASRSEINPWCVNCYLPPPPYRNEKERIDSEKIAALLEKKAQSDWYEEIEILRKKGKLLQLKPLINSLPRWIQISLPASFRNIE